jgi:hypothetical protein
MPDPSQAAQGINTANNAQSSQALVIQTYSNSVNPTVAKICECERSRGHCDGLFVMQQLVLDDGVCAHRQRKPTLRVGEAAGSLDQLAA